MNAYWKRVLTKGSEEEELKSLFLSSGEFREKLSELLSSLSEERLIDDYDCPNWQLKRAEENGRVKATELILKLIKGKD